MQVNRDVTTRLPMDEAVAGLSAGIYALRAVAPVTANSWNSAARRAALKSAASPVTP